jgi:hypothetical protein
MSYEQTAISVRVGISQISAPAEEFNRFSRRTPTKHWQTSVVVAGQEVFSLQIE